MASELPSFYGESVGARRVACRTSTMGWLIHIMRIDLCDSILDISRMRAAGVPEAKIVETAGAGSKMLIKTLRALERHVENIRELGRHCVLAQHSATSDQCLCFHSVCNTFPGAKKARRLLGSAPCETVAEEENGIGYEDCNKPGPCLAKAAVGLCFSNAEAFTSSCTTVVTLLTSDIVQGGDERIEVHRCQLLPSEPAASSNCPITNSKLIKTPTPSRIIPVQSPCTNQSGSGWCTGHGVGWFSCSSRGSPL